MMPKRVLVVLLIIFCTLDLLAAEQVPLKVKVRMDELWRRGMCMLSSVVKPAERSSRVPDELGGAMVLDGRTLVRRNGFTCSACDEKAMWLATDARVDKVDLASGKRLASFTPADGLRDSPIDELVIDGRRLWILTRTGLACLDTAENRFHNSQMPGFRVAKLLAGAKAIWVVADSGTFLLDRKTDTWRQLPAIPTAQAVRTRLEQGIWRLRWKSYTAGMIEDIALAGGKLWALSMGTLSCLDCDLRNLHTVGWKQVSSDAWAMKADGNKLWVLTTSGVDCYDGTNNDVTHYTSGDGLAVGRHKLIAITEKSVWVASEPTADAQTAKFIGGGISRFDKDKKQWSQMTKINGVPVTQTTYLANHAGELWVGSTVFDKLITLSAHPGMMHVKQLRPHVTGLALHYYLAQNDRWETIECGLPVGRERYILGQRGTVHRDRLVPKAIIGLAPNRTQIYCSFKMLPSSYYGGYCHSIGAFAGRRSAGDEWSTTVEDVASETGLAGEQPELLLVSESHGKKVVFAEGQPRALHIGIHQGQVWALSERALTCCREGIWQKVVENPDRFYWDVTTAVADGEYLWIGGDAGTISRLDKKSLGCKIVARLKGRKVTALALDSQGRLWVESAPAKVVMPANLNNLRQVSSQGLAIYDGKSWKEARPEQKLPRSLPAGKYEWYCRSSRRGRERESVLYRRERAGGSEVRFAYLRGVFRPQVLCEDEGGKVLWLKIYEGLLRIDLSG